MKKLASRPVWIFDVDDCLYTIDCGLHDNIKGRICAHANGTPDIRKNAAPWLGQDRDFTPADLGIAFPKIVMTFLDLNPAGLDKYLEDVYGDDYGLISPNPAFVNALNLARQKGVRIVFYTNGPSSPHFMKEYHTQKVLRRVGLSSSFNEAARKDTYDLLMSVKAGYGKPSEQGMENFLKALRIDPQQAIFFDDGLKNLKAGIDKGMLGVWTWTSDAPPKESDRQLARQLNAVQIRDVGKTVETLARLAPVFR